MSEKSEKSENNENKKTENDYLEMANDCMKRIEVKDKEIIKWKTEYMIIKKEIANIFGLIRSLNNYLENVSPDICYDPIVEFLLDDIRRLTRDPLFEAEELQLGISTTEEFRIIIENLEEANPIM